MDFQILPPLPFAQQHELFPFLPPQNVIVVEKEKEENAEMVPVNTDDLASASLEQLLTEIKNRGILITDYTIDQEKRQDLTWSRRRHAVIAYYALRRHR